MCVHLIIFTFGFFFITGLGRTAPDPNATVTLNGVQVPLGKGVHTNIDDTSLLYNEYPLILVCLVICVMIFFLPACLYITCAVKKVSKICYISILQSPAISLGVSVHLSLIQNLMIQSHSSNSVHLHIKDQREVYNREGKLSHFQHAVQVRYNKLKTSEFTHGNSFIAFCLLIQDYTFHCVAHPAVMHKSTHLHCL